MNIKADPLNLVICGVGGQGNILISRMIGRILFRKGYYVTIGETFGAAQRGGAVHSSMRVSKKREYGPLIPTGKAHCIAGLEPLETLRMLRIYGNDKVFTITNTQPVYPVSVVSGKHKYPEYSELTKMIAELSLKSWLVNVTDIANILGAPIVSNIILLGSLVGIQCLPLTVKEVQNEIRSTLPPKVVDLNLKALTLGLQAV